MIRFQLSLRLSGGAVVVGRRWPVVRAPVSAPGSLPPPPSPPPARRTAPTIPAETMTPAAANQAARRACPRGRSAIDQTSVTGSADGSGNQRLSLDGGPHHRRHLRCRDERTPDGLDQRATRVVAILLRLRERLGDHAVQPVRIGEALDGRWRIVQLAVDRGDLGIGTEGHAPREAWNRTQPSE